MKKCCNL